jgi:hypothetical protein
MQGHPPLAMTFLGVILEPNAFFLTRPPHFYDDIPISLITCSTNGARDASCIISCSALAAFCLVSPVPFNASLITAAISSFENYGAAF